MASYFCRTKVLFQFSRYVPSLVARAQASQSIPTSGGGAPMSGSTKTVSQTGGTQKGDSSVLPKSSTGSDHTNPTKTSSDAPPLDHENIDLKNKQTDKKTSSTSTKKSKTSSSSSDEFDNEVSVMNSTMGQFGMAAVLALAIYAGYQMMKDRAPQKNDLKNNEHYKRATADYQESNAQGTDVKK
ncbi:hypothetical protein I4U23_013988 [Adineta vaga]|nr:hypothetical protein I4U23_013988 [Adineta vaga]